MKNRIFSLFLAFLILLAAVPTAQATGFTDTRDHWAKDYIDSAVELGLFNGVTETRFDPNGTMTRGMFVTVLGRMEGIDADLWSADKVELSFDDVKADAYYAPYINWASYCGIVNGMDEHSFAPDVLVTREQIVTMLHRFAGYREVDRYYVTKLEAYDDCDSIGAWAFASMQWAAAEDLLNDSADLLRPKDTATRAEVAQLLWNYCKAVANSATFFTPSYWIIRGR